MHEWELLRIKCEVMGASYREINRMISELRNILKRVQQEPATFIPYDGFDQTDIIVIEAKIEALNEIKSKLKGRFCELKERMRRSRLAASRSIKHYLVQLNCGCCEDELYFTSDEAIDKAFETVGLTSNGVITDELGRTVRGIDTFYDWRYPGEEQRGLGYLFDSVFGPESGHKGDKSMDEDELTKVLISVFDDCPRDEMIELSNDSDEVRRRIRERFGNDTLARASRTSSDVWAKAWEEFERHYEF